MLVLVLFSFVGGCVVASVVFNISGAGVSVEFAGGGSGVDMVLFDSCGGSKS